jgi:MFS transporter, Spinster family, sphingosine-1-phosphate transporter
MNKVPEYQTEEGQARRWLGIEWPRFAGWQWKVLLLLTAVNLLNYFDRLIVFPMFAYWKDEFRISDFKLGLVGSVFIVVNSLSVLPLGYWSDRRDRQKIMAGGVLFWSFATALSGFAATFKTLLAARALVGVGEAAYAPGGTAMMTSSFPPRFRARVQSVFNFGMLVGGVLGLAAGGVLSQWFGWRSAFFLVGLPGFLLALALDRMRVPVTVSSEPAPPARNILKIPAYLAVLAGGMFVVFSSSAFATWGVEFSARYHEMSVAQASLWLATLVLAGSVGGVFIGGYVADQLQDRWPWGRAVTIAASLLLGTPFLYFAISTGSRSLFLFCLFVATFMLTCYHGPATAVIHDLTSRRAHAFSFAFYMFFIHLFGDAVAPALVGRVSDLSDLRMGLTIAVAANFLAAVCFFLVAWLIRVRAVRRSQPAA